MITHHWNCHHFCETSFLEISDFTIFYLPIYVILLTKHGCHHKTYPYYGIEPLFIIYQNKFFIKRTACCTLSIFFLALSILLVFTGKLHFFVRRSSSATPSIARTANGIGNVLYSRKKSSGKPVSKTGLTGLHSGQTRKAGN
ncbi:hypothetical protein T4C_5695 [Trichinella pseudospiralis]|uniref:Transmembrane protein n=1 Tax=Trichinella pseudospiralis TaxID=6337 RepID=A0A0V1JQ40_TRIPS|nr:hypothetical protein T4C_5695 [Trichinella pseudospiralis]